MIVDPKKNINPPGAGDWGQWNDCLPSLLKLFHLFSFILTYFLFKGCIVFFYNI